MEYNLDKITKYKEYILKNKNNMWVIFDSNENQLCDNMGCELEFSNIEEAQKYIDEQLN